MRWLDWRWTESDADYMEMRLALFEEAVTVGEAFDINGVMFVVDSAHRLLAPQPDLLPGEEAWLVSARRAPEAGAGVSVRRWRGNPPTLTAGAEARPPNDEAGGEWLL